MQISKASDERRYSSRIYTRLAAEVINRNEESAEATITDLSTGGFTLEVDAPTLSHIEVIDTELGEPYFPVQASVAFDVPLNGAPSRIEATCRLVHNRRLSQNTYNIGMMIIAIDEGQRKQLARYIDDTIKP